MQKFMKSETSFIQFFFPRSFSFSYFFRTENSQTKSSFNASIIFSNDLSFHFIQQKEKQEKELFLTLVRPMYSHYSGKWQSWIIHTPAFLFWLINLCTHQTNKSKSFQSNQTEIYSIWVKFFLLLSISSVPTQVQLRILG